MCDITTIHDPDQLDGLKRKALFSVEHPEIHRDAKDMGEYIEISVLPIHEAHIIPGKRILLDVEGSDSLLLTDGARGDHATAMARKIVRERVADVVAGNAAVAIVDAQIEAITSVRNDRVDMVNNTIGQIHALEKEYGEDVLRNDD